MDARERRLAENEALFREVNERVDAAAHQLGADAAYEFLCECVDADCTLRIELPVRVYETIRAEPRQFVVRPFHHRPEAEEIVAEEDGYWVVRKTGEAGDYAARLDPRGR